MLENLPGVVGHILRDRRAGLDKIVFNRCGLRSGHGTMTLASLAFADHAPMPARYTADGEGVSPPLHWSGVPANAHSLVMIVEDADAPTGEPLVHAILVDMPAEDDSLPEAVIGDTGEHADDVHEGRNSYFRAGWLPPDPPPGHGEHRYAFQLFALGEGAAFKGKPGRDELMAAIQERGIASAILVGTYTRPDGSIRADGEQPVAA